MFLWILRGLASVFTGLVVFVSLLLLLASAGAMSILDAETYLNALDEVNVYQRIYSEVLTPEILEEFREALFVDPEFLSSEDIGGLLPRLAPPAYLQSQVESNATLMDEYLSGESSTLKLYLQLDGPLDRLEAEIVEIVGQRIEEAPARDSNETNETDETRTFLAGVAGSAQGQYADETSDTIESLMTGENIPTSVLNRMGLTEAEVAAIESLLTEERILAEESGLSRESILTSVSNRTGLTEAEVLDVFNRSVATVIENQGVDQRFRDALREAEPELRQIFATGDTKAFISQATHTVVAPAVEIAVDDLNIRLDEQGRVDLVALLAEEVMEVEESQLQDTAREWRDRLITALFWGRIAPIVALFLSAALMLLVYWRRPMPFFRWTYLTLLMAGGAALATVLVAYFTLPGATEAAMEGLIHAQLDGLKYPLPGLTPLASELANTVVASLVGSLIWIAAIPPLVGVILWLLDLVYQKWLKVPKSKYAEVAKPGPGDPETPAVNYL